MCKRIVYTKNHASQANIDKRRERCSKVSRQNTSKQPMYAHVPTHESNTNGARNCNRVSSKQLLHVDNKFPPNSKGCWNAAANFRHKVTQTSSISKQNELMFPLLLGMFADGRLVRSSACAWSIPIQYIYSIYTRAIPSWTVTEQGISSYKWH